MERMQMKKIAIACGMALGTLGFTQAASAATVDLFISGATAQDVNLEKVVVDLCDLTLAPATRKKWTSANNRTWECIVDPAQVPGLTGVAVGDTLRISKESNGGSGNGIGPVATPSNLVRANTNGVGCTGTSGVVDIDPTAGVALFTVSDGCPVAGPQFPKAGVSDVEPRLFGVNSGLQTTATIALQFAPALSDELYKKLQALQGKTVGDFSEAQAPTIKSADLRAIMGGQILDWTQVNGGITPNGSGTTALKLCRRGNTSGTQKSYEVRMLQAGCAGATTANSGALNTIASNLGDDYPNNGTTQNTNTSSGAGAAGGGGFRGYTGVYTVVLNSSAGDVDACLTAADSQGELAIGLLSTERQPGVGNDDPDGVADRWHYPKMDNIYPSTINMLTGQWDNLWTQSVLNRRPAGYTLAEASVIARIAANLGSPTVINGLGLIGAAGLPSNGFTYDNGISPIVYGERRTPGGDVNNCQDTLVQP